MDPNKLQRLAELAEPHQRRRAARGVAEVYGADCIILFIRDPGVDVLLPASGFPQTLPNGKLWQAFLTRCAEAGTAREMLTMPDSRELQPVVGIAAGSDAVMAFVGGTLSEDAFSDIPLMLPLLHLALKGEHLARIAEANAQLAAQRLAAAHHLAESLENARKDLAATLVQSRAAQNELKLADQNKNAFLALLAHELRNPLAPIGNALELLRLNADQPGMIRKIREIMHTQFTQMVRLIDDLMDVSRISTGKIFLRKETVDLCAVISGAVEAARPQIDAKSHTLDLRLPNKHPTVFADPIRLNQVFLNLLINAATYTAPGGTITVIVSESAGHVVVDVVDTGRGVSEELASKIFTMFTQGDDSTSRPTGGLGIGLGLAKSLVELHGGTIRVTSPGVNQGSTFTVRLPATAGEVAKEAPEAQAALPLERGLRALVVDDNEDSATTLGWTLSALGHECRLAFNGADALRIAETYEPQLVLLDIGMPGMSGYEVCAKLRALSALKNSLFIAQTGWGLQHDKIKAKAAGFDHHLVKPINMDELTRIIENFRRMKRQ